MSRGLPGLMRTAYRPCTCKGAKSTHHQASRKVCKGGRRSTFRRPAHPPIKAHVAADSERPPGEWNSMDVLVRGGCIDVTINGVAQNAVTIAQPATGRIGFQLEGTPYELRNLRVERL